MYGGYPLDIGAGADVLYLLHPDGSAPLDADGSGATNGDFSKRGRFFAGGPSLRRRQR